MSDHELFAGNSGGGNDSGEAGGANMERLREARSAADAFASSSERIYRFRQNRNISATQTLQGIRNGGGQ